MQTGIYAVVVAAGKGERLGAQVNKVLLPLCGKPVVWHAVKAFCDAPQIDGVCVVTSEAEQQQITRILQDLPKVCAVVCGGDTRQQSVVNGLLGLPAQAQMVMVHDGARPLVSGELIADCAASLLKHGSAVACAQVTDTIKSVSPSGEEIEGTIERSGLRAVQTPQCFYWQELCAGYANAMRKGLQVTDDASVMEAMGMKVHLVQSHDCNIKLTVPGDLLLAQAVMMERNNMQRLPRTGYGFDVHRLVKGRKLMLCGVEIPYEMGLDGHSDADVAVHALIDALLGAACLGDIGRLYPDNDPGLEGVDSMRLLQDVVKKLKDVRIVHVDITIVAQKPKLAQYMPRMVERIQGALPDAQVNIKASTTEKLGFEGRGEGMSAHAVATLW